MIRNISAKDLDFYFSAENFKKSKELYKEGKFFGYLCEALIGEKWVIYTEQIRTGKDPLSREKYDDVVFLGTSKEYRVYSFHTFMEQEAELEGNVD